MIYKLSRMAKSSKNILSIIFVVSLNIYSFIRVIWFMKGIIVIKWGIEYTSFDSSCDELLEEFFLGFSDIGLGLDFSCSQHLDLLSASWFLDLSLQLFLSLSLWVSLGKNCQLSQSEVWLVLNEVLLVVIGQTESTWSVTTESSSESIENEVLDVPSVLGWDKSSEISSGDVGLTFVVNVEK